jgi:hypothetical protein
MNPKTNPPNPEYPDRTHTVIVPCPKPVPVHLDLRIRPLTLPVAVSMELPRHCARDCDQARARLWGSRMGPR